MIPIHVLPEGFRVHPKDLGSACRKAILEANNLFHQVQKLNSTLTQVLEKYIHANIT